MVNNAILEKTMSFSIRIVKMYSYLKDEKKEFVLSKQVLRSGTSIGANAHEAHNGESDKDFLHKMYIALKEATETEYWLLLLLKTEFLPENHGYSVLKDCVELKRILTAIIKTTKTKIKAKETKAETRKQGTENKKEKSNENTDDK